MAERLRQRQEAQRQLQEAQRQLERERREARRRALADLERRRVETQRDWNQFASVGMAPYPVDQLIHNYMLAHGRDPRSAPLWQHY
jgi:hypothetical protein